MAHFILFGTDHPDMLETRKATRPAHVAFLGNPAPHKVKVVHGGPTLAEDGESMNGSFLLLEADSLEAAKAFAADDPYAKAGIFKTVEIRPTNWVIGNPDRS